MRTTLKRGIGRGGAVNGNGHGVLPPSAIEPMRRYRQPPPPPRSTRTTLWRVFGWILLALVVVGSGIAGGAYLYFHETLNALAPHSKSVKAATRLLHKVPPPSEPATALLLGYDARAGVDSFGASGSRSDTIILMRANPQNNTLSMLSFPRDLVVPIYCPKSSAPITTDRINTAFTSCGPAGTLDTVEKLTGVPVNYLITVDFHGFKLLVNKLHGVYLDVDQRYLNTHGGPGGYATINLDPGYQLLNGQQALDYVRYRHTDSDLYRNARQQLFIEALKSRLANNVSLFDIPQLIGAVKGSIEIGSGNCSTCAPSLSDIESYAGLAYRLPSGHLFRDDIANLQPYGLDNAELIASTTDLANAVDVFLNPDVRQAAQANAVAVGKKPPVAKGPPLKPSQISTLVLNGTTIPGLARDTSYKLAVAGYDPVNLPADVLADAPSQSEYGSTVYYDAVQAHAKQAARQLKIAFGAHTSIAPLPEELSGYAQEAGNPLTVIVVGSSFGGTIENPQAHVTPPPTYQAPSVRVDPSATLSAIESVRSKLPFEPYVPTTIDSSSRLAYLEPVRAFKPVPFKHELVLTFVTGAGNVYWQVIETDWANAPILDHPTGTERIKGRAYSLYTTGGNIHMVVFHVGDRSYWVVNSLRDELSNETMVSIAKGLQPLARAH
ncbi:MAG TPA: LCP family protein [Gaiellaceae bacterium]|nr:LCP family protein [Gaiellaceae bacterium]